MKKDCIKVAVFVFVSFLTAVFIYPFLHESGHSIVAVLLKGISVLAMAISLVSVYFKESS